MFKGPLPILGVSNSEVVEEFYCGKRGFHCQYAYRPNPKTQDPCYMGVARDAAHIVVSSFDPDGPPDTRNVQIYLEDITAIYDEYKQADISVGDMMDQTWGNLEFGFVDPHGNRLGIAENKGSTESA